MAKLTRKRGKVSGSVAVNKQLTHERGAVLDIAETDGTVVKAGASITISQNYNSFKVEVGIELPTTLFDVDKTFKEAWEKVDSELARQQQMAQKVLDEL